MQGDRHGSAPCEAATFGRGLAIVAVIGAALAQVAASHGATPWPTAAFALPAAVVAGVGVAVLVRLGLGAVDRRGRWVASVASGATVALLNLLPVAAHLAALSPADDPDPVGLVAVGASLLALAAALVIGTRAPRDATASQRAMVRRAALLGGLCTFAAGLLLGPGVASWTRRYAHPYVMGAAVATLLAAAVVVTALVWLSCAAEAEGPPAERVAPHRVVLRVGFAATFAGPLGAAALVVCFSAHLRPLLGGPALLAGVTVGALVLVLVALEELTRWVRRERRLALLLGGGLLGPLAAVGCWSWGMTLLEGADWLRAAERVAEVAAASLLDRPREGAAIALATAAPFGLLGAARGGLLSRGQALAAWPRSGQAALGSVALAVTFSIAVGRSSYVSPGRCAMLAAASLLVPWAVVLGLDLARRAEAWWLERWERRRAE